MGGIGGIGSGNVGWNPPKDPSWQDKANIAIDHLRQAMADVIAGKPVSQHDIGFLQADIQDALFSMPQDADHWRQQEQVTKADDGINDAFLKWNTLSPNARMDALQGAITNLQNALNT